MSAGCVGSGPLAALGAANAHCFGCFHVFPMVASPTHVGEVCHADG